MPEIDPSSSALRGARLAEIPGERDRVPGRILDRGESVPSRRRVERLGADAPAGEICDVKADREGVERDAAYSAAAEVARQVDEVLNNFQAVRTWLLLLAFVLVCLAVSLAS
ncbi:MAG: hypothetical protein M3357_03305 [Actinomycetota bacterium]|nr:hypothetical protein [Actinomycetota bacterium]